MLYIISFSHVNGAITAPGRRPRPPPGFHDHLLLALDLVGSGALFVQKRMLRIPPIVISPSTPS
jgi:hypothetical protein